MLLRKVQTEHLLCIIRCQMMQMMQITSNKSYESQHRKCLLEFQSLVSNANLLIKLTQPRT